MPVTADELDALAEKYAGYSTESRAELERLGFSSPERATTYAAMLRYVQSSPGCSEPQCEIGTHAGHPKRCAVHTILRLHQDQGALIPKDPA